jgi:hypothetical protein
MAETRQRAARRWKTACANAVQREAKAVRAKAARMRAAGPDRRCRLRAQPPPPKADRRREPDRRRGPRKKPTVG